MKLNSLYNFITVLLLGLVLFGCFMVGFIYGEQSGMYKEIKMADVWEYHYNEGGDIE